MDRNNTTGATMEKLSQTRLVLSSIFITVVMLVTIVGNSLVIFCVCYYPRLRGRTNFLIVSLAVADWLIGMLSDPFKLVQNLNHGVWPSSLNESGCYVWIATDMLCSAVSIISLMAISIDRLIAITDPLKYEERMRPRHVYAMIAITWVFGLFCAGLSLVKWNDQPVVQLNPACGMRSREYITFVATAAFFVPLVVVLLNYAFIFRIAIHHARRLAKENDSLAVNYQLEQDRINGNHNSNHDSGHLVSRTSSCKSEDRFIKRQKNKLNFTRRNSTKPSRHAKLSMVKQLKATKTLAVVVGVFTLCWLPFFIIYLTWQHCPDCFKKDKINREVLNVLLIIFIDVLPVANSAANPLIYTCFNAEFRKSFKKILWKILRVKQPLDSINSSFTGAPTSAGYHRNSNLQDHQIV